MPYPFQDRNLKFPPGFLDFELVPYCIESNQYSIQSKSDVVRDVVLVSVSQHSRVPLTCHHDICIG